MKTEFYLSILSLGLLVTSCSKKKDKMVDPGKQGANITLISPTRGQAGTAVTIDGQGFTVNPKDVVTVLFNGKKAQVVSLSATQVTAYAPVGAASGPVQVVTSMGDTLTGSIFTYGAPLYISSLTPAFGPPGTVVRVRGTGFGNSNSLVRFYFNGLWAAFKGDITDTAVSVVLPSYLKPGNTRLVVGTDSVSGPLFTPTAITGLIPTMGLDGTLDTIMGTGFSPVLSENIVTYKGITATVISGDSSQLVVKVPKGASGNAIVAVTINGNSTKPTQPELQNNICVFADTTLMLTYTGYRTRRNTGEYDTIRVATGPVGSFVQIHGYGFNWFPGNTQVTFNGMPAAVIGGGIDTILYAKVPQGATNGPIRVTSNGQTVTGPNYTIIPGGVSTFAGNYNSIDGLWDPWGPFTDGACAPLYNPFAIAFDNQRQSMYVLDYNWDWNWYTSINTVFQLSPDGSNATILAKDNNLVIPSTMSKMVVDKTTGTIYTASDNNIWTLSNGDFQVFAGSATYRGGFTDGKGTSALFQSIAGLTIDAQGNMWAVDSRNNCIRKIASDGTVTTPYPKTIFTNYQPNGAITLDKQGNFYYSSGSNDNAIVKMTPNGNQLAIAHWPFTNNVWGINGAPNLAFDDNGNLFFTSGGNIFQVVNGSPVRVAGAPKYGNHAGGGYIDGDLNTALFNTGGGNNLLFDAAGNMYEAEFNSAAIRKIVLH